MRDTITLTEAIAANEKGLESLRVQRNENRRLELANKQRADALQREIDAREKMTEAMKAVQASMPGDETLKFIIPR